MPEQNQEGPDKETWSREFNSQRAQTIALTAYITCDAATILCGQIDLALRHPENQGPSAKVASTFVEGLIDRLEQQGFPALAAAARRDHKDTLAIYAATGKAPDA